MLMRNHKHSWVVINSLIRLHLLNFDVIYLSISPIKVPITVFIFIKLVIQLSTSLFDNSVLGLSNAQNKFRQWLLFFCVVIPLVIFYLKDFFSNRCLWLPLVILLFIIIAFVLILLSLRLSLLQWITDFRLLLIGITLELIGIGTCLLVV